MTDAAGGRGGVGIRLYTSGGDLVKRNFNEIGDSGKRMWAEIATGQRTAHPALSALNTGSVQAKAGIGSLANQAKGGMSALSAFGTAGVAAAAALGAVAIASANFRETLTWAADLKDASDKVGISAEALQNLRYAADETGVPLDALDGALQKLNGSLGAMQTGLGSAKVKGAFKELGIDAADLKGMQNASDLLPLIADRISKVDTVASRVQILKKLQIADLEPLLRGGSVELARFTGEAESLGFTLSNDVVDGLDETERKLEKNQQQIDANVRAMQANLAPFFLWCSDWLATLARGFTDMLNQGAKVEDRNARVLASQSESLQRKVTFAYQQAPNQPNGQLTPVQQGWVRERDAVNAQIAANARARIAAGSGPAAADRPQDEEDPDKPKNRSGGGRGRSAADTEARDAARRQVEADRAQDELEREEQRAQRERIQLLYGGDTTQARATLAEELARLDRDERDASRAALRFDLISAGASEEAADTQMQALRDLDKEADALAALSRTQVARAALAAERFSNEKAAAADAITLSEIQGQLATTEKARTAIARRTLLLRQQMERAELQTESEKDGFTTPAEFAAQQRQNAIQSGEILLFDAREEQRVRETFMAAGRDVVSAIQNGRLGEYIGDQLKAKLLDGALNALFNMMSGASKSEGGGWVNSLAKFGMSFFGKHSAGGYISGPGGPTDDSIPAFLSNGEYVINAAATKRLRPLLDRINNGAVDRFAVGGLAGPAEIGEEEGFAL